MDYTKILLLVKYTKQIHNSLEDSSHPDTFNTIADIKNEIQNDDFLSLYLSKLNGSEELYLFFSIYFYHKNGDAAKSVKYVLENLKGYRFQVFELGVINLKNVKDVMVMEEKSVSIVMDQEMKNVENVMDLVRKHVIHVMVMVKSMEKIVVSVVVVVM